MIKLLTPLGLLGLLTILILILIYIIKPNYQSKRISTTFVWKLSLKYRKKKIPVSKLRNILLILCQVLILCLCAVILAQPNQVLKIKAEKNVVVAIIDSSASMRTKTDGENRFERAVKKLKADLDELPSNSVVSVIVADSNPHFIRSDVPIENKVSIIDDLDKLLDDPMACSYGSSDIEKAISLCDNIFRDNPDASITLYTDNSYSYVPKKIKLVDVKSVGEKNVGILNAYAEFEEGYYAFYIQVASYGAASVINLDVNVQGANYANSLNKDNVINYQKIVECEENVTKTIVFKYLSDDVEVPDTDENSNTEYYYLNVDERVNSFTSANISLNVEDSFEEDNNFDIYGGEKETIKVQYATNLPNSFFNGIMFVLTSQYADRFNIVFDEVRTNETNPKLEGYDFYIFEHQMPMTLPSDGIVFVVDPSFKENETLPTNIGIRVNEDRDFHGNMMPLTKDETHPITSKIHPEKVTVSRYNRIVEYDSDYRVLMRCDNDPVLLVKDGSNEKIVIMAFSVHYGNIEIRKEFPLLFKNMFDYFMPPMVIGNAFEVYVDIAWQGRGDSLNVSLNGDEHDKVEFTTFPASFSASIPGTYVVEQTTFANKIITEDIYVKIPAAESNIFSHADSLPDPYEQREEENDLRDLMVFIVAALVAIMFAEWLLRHREE